MVETTSFDLLSRARLARRETGQGEFAEICLPLSDSLEPEGCSKSDRRLSGCQSLLPPPVAAFSKPRRRVVAGKYTLSGRFTRKGYGVPKSKATHFMQRRGKNDSDAAAVAGKIRPKSLA
jgi:hypothetical protein